MLAIPTAALAVVGSVWIFVIMILINLDVFGRAALGRPIDGVPEMVSLSIVGIVFLQLAHTLRKRRFISSDMLLTRLRKSRPNMAQALEGLYLLFGALTFAVITYYIGPKFADAWQEGTYVGGLGRFTAPIWPILLLILIGSTLTAVQSLFDAIQHILAALGVVDPPFTPSAQDAEFD